MKRYKNAMLVFLVITSSVLLLISACAQQKGNNAELPKNAIVLFNGTDFSQWTDQSGETAKWDIIGNAMQVVPLDRAAYGGKWPEGMRKRGIQTKEKFQDFKLHVEFNVPDAGKDNSGVYIQRRYEIQIVNSFAGYLEYSGTKHGNNCGAIYKQKQPDTIASKKPGEWQTYDITFRAARFKEVDGKGKKVENARVSVLLNGVLVQNDVEILHQTGVGDPEGPEAAPLLLQDHGGLIQYRNVWILPIEG
jgi:hypothetical protein